MSENLSLFRKRTFGIRKPMGFARTSLALVNLCFGKALDEGKGVLMKNFSDSRVPTGRPWYGAAAVLLN